MSDTSESAGPQQTPARPSHLFKPGQSGNPAGRPVGSRNKLTNDFAADLHELWKERGRSVLATAAETEPMKFVAMVASLMPRDVNISARPFTEFTDDDLRNALARIEDAIARGVDPTGAGQTIEGESTRVLPALPEAAGVPREG